MRKIILSLHVTPDGFCNHDTAVMSDDWLHAVNELTASAGTALFGRVTYQLFEAFWPGMARDRPGSAEVLRCADLLEAMEKIVFSATLSQTEWRNVRIEPVLTPEKIQAIKALPGKDIIVFGGAKFISELIMLDAFDEYYLNIQPVLAGAGYRLFSEVKRDRLALDLVDAQTFESGVLMLHYRPKRGAKS